jgi:hypothetical protein
MTAQLFSLQHHPSGLITIVMASVTMGPGITLIRILMDAQGMVTDTTTQILMKVVPHQHMILREVAAVIVAEDLHRHQIEVIARPMFT